MPWFRVQFDRNEVRDGSAERFADALALAFAAREWHPDAVTYVETQICGQGHGVVSAGRILHYVSPRGADLAPDVLARFAGEPCGPPSPERVTVGLCRGDRDHARRLLFTSR